MGKEVSDGFSHAACPRTHKHTNAQEQTYVHARYLRNNQLTGSLEALRELEQLTILYVAWVLAGAVGGVEWYGVVRSGARDC